MSFNKRINMTLCSVFFSSLAIASNPPPSAPECKIARYGEATIQVTSYSHEQLPNGGWIANSKEVCKTKAPFVIYQDTKACMITISPMTTCDVTLDGVVHPLQIVGHVNVEHALSPAYTDSKNYFLTVFNTVSSPSTDPITSTSASTSELLLKDLSLAISSQTQFPIPTQPPSDGFLVSVKFEDPNAN